MRLRTVGTSEPGLEDGNYLDLSGADRSRGQMIYVPANRDGASQVTAFRGRLWQAVG